jgi:hypothetical protein
MIGNPLPGNDLFFVNSWGQGFPRSRVRFGTFGLDSEKQNGQQPKLRELNLVYRFSIVSSFLPGAFVPFVQFVANSGCVTV